MKLIDEETPTGGRLIQDDDNADAWIHFEPKPKYDYTVVKGDTEGEWITTNLIVPARA